MAQISSVSSHGPKWQWQARSRGNVWLTAMEAFRNLLDSAPGTLSDMYLTYISAMKTGLDSLPKSLPTTLMELHAFWRSFPVIWFLIGMRCSDLGQMHVGTL